MATCSSCGHENPDEQKFCGECGTKLDVTPIREERKVITGETMARMVGAPVPTPADDRGPIPGYRIDLATS